MKVFLTGHAGFIGTCLAPRLRARGHSLILSQADVRDVPALRKELTAASPDVILHFAALSHVPTCEADPETAWQVNVGGTQALLTAMSELQRPAHLVFPSSATVYAPPSADMVRDRQPLHEASPIEPKSVYANTKWQAELLVSDRALLGLHSATILRLFTHTHHTQPAEFFLPHIFEALHSVPRGSAVEISVGNIEIERDIGAVQDLLRLLETLIEGPGATNASVEVFNVCSGTAKRLRDLVEGLAQREERQATFRVDAARIRQESSWFCGTAAKAEKHFGWHPEATTSSRLLDAFLAEA